MLRRYLPLLLWIVAFQLIGGAIGFITSSGMEWYDGLKKSTLTPPDYIFPIAWSMLYILIAATGWIYWRARKEPQARPLLILYAAYVPLNWSWSFVFFQFHLAAIAFFWIMVMNVINIALIIKSHRTHPTTASMMLPPLLWTGFAAYLNYVIWIQNM